MDLRPVLKPEGSLAAGLAVVALVWGDYQLHMGDLVTVHASPPNHDVLESQRRKAGWSALALVAGVSVLARDPNIFLLGSSAIIALELSTRHAIMSNAETGRVELPAPSDYAPAQASAAPDYQAA